MIIKRNIVTRTTIFYGGYVQERTEEGMKSVYTIHIDRQDTLGNAGLAALALAINELLNAPL